jgi:hypothetical protein
MLCVVDQIYLSVKKSDYLVCYSGASGFDSFRVKLRKELDLEI